MKVVAIGNRAFVAGLHLAGVEGMRVSSSDEALREIHRLLQEKDVGLILVSDDVARDIRPQLTNIRTKRPVPIIFEVPAPGSKKERLEYRDLLKQILGM